MTSHTLCISLTDLYILLQLPRTVSRMGSTAKMSLIFIFSQHRPLQHIVLHHLNGLLQALPRMERVEAIHTNQTLPGIEIFGETACLVFYVVNMRHIYFYYAHSCRIIHPPIPKSLVDFFFLCLVYRTLNTCLLSCWQENLLEFGKRDSGLIRCFVT